jgi:hypothetical protein
MDTPTRIIGITEEMYFPLETCNITSHFYLSNKKSCRHVEDFSMFKITVPHVNGKAAAVTGR